MRSILNAVYQLFADSTISITQRGSKTRSLPFDKWLAEPLEEDPVVRDRIARARQATATAAGIAHMRSIFGAAKGGAS